MSSARRELAALGAQAVPAAPAGGGRAFGLGPHGTARLLGLALVVLLVAVPAGILTIGSGRAAVHRAGAHGGAAKTRYGGLPSWLPRASVPVNRVLEASPAHSVLTIQGDTVSVALGRGRALVTTVGPSVPEDGRFPVPATSPCTFVVTFAHVDGAIPLSPRAFTLVDEYGHIRHPHVTSMDGGPPPARIVPGRTQSLKIYDVLPTGDGGLAWAPDGGRPLVSWDFNVEID